MPTRRYLGRARALLLGTRKALVISMASRSGGHCSVSSQMYRIQEAVLVPVAAEIPTEINLRYMYAVQHPQLKKKDKAVDVDLKGEVTRMGSSSRMQYS